MQYTLRNIPRQIDQALRKRARKKGQSLNETAVEALALATGVSLAPERVRDLGDIAGTWQDDPACETALAEQRRIDPEAW